MYWTLDIFVLIVLKDEQQCVMLNQSHILPTSQPKNLKFILVSVVLHLQAIQHILWTNPVNYVYIQLTCNILKDIWIWLDYILYWHYEDVMLLNISGMLQNNVDNIPNFLWFRSGTGSPKFLEKNPALGVLILFSPQHNWENKWKCIYTYILRDRAVLNPGEQGLQG